VGITEVTIFELFLFCNKTYKLPVFEFFVAKVLSDCQINMHLSARWTKVIRDVGHFLLVIQLDSAIYVT